MAYQKGKQPAFESKNVIKESLGGTAIDLRAPSTQKMYWSANSAFLDSTKAADKGGKSLLKAFTENIGACIDQQLSKCKEGYEIKAFSVACSCS